MKQKFKVGEKYKVYGDCDLAENGNIIEISKIGTYDEVFYKTIKGYNPGRKSFYIGSHFSDCLKPLDYEETIVIYRKDNETIALDKRTGKKAVAKCSPEDTYNFETGAKLAFERLTNDVTFRVLCIKDVYFANLALKKGKVYTYINGGCVLENGYISEKYNSYKDLIRCNPLYKNATVELKHGDNAEEILKKCEEKQPLNTKIIFTKGDDVFKTGHIYKIENGKLKWPGEDKFLPGFSEYHEAFYSIEEVKDYFTGSGKRKLHKFGWSSETLEFIEVVYD